jgi:hypothetical protein
VSSDGFEVDLGALSAAREQVGRLAEELAEPPRDVPSVEAFGHDRLAEAVNEFVAREERGLASLTGEAESIHQRLAETIKTYREMDEGVAGRFGGIA